MLRGPRILAGADLIAKGLQSPVVPVDFGTMWDRWWKDVGQHRRGRSNEDFRRFLEKHFSALRSVILLPANAGEFALALEQILRRLPKGSTTISLADYLASELEGTAGLEKPLGVDQGDLALLSGRMGFVSASYPMTPEMVRQGSCPGYLPIKAKV